MIVVAIKVRIAMVGIRGAPGMGMVEMMGGECK